jgi:hypothetical protein
MVAAEHSISARGYVASLRDRPQLSLSLSLSSPSSLFFLTGGGNAQVVVAFGWGQRYPLPAARQWTELAPATRGGQQRHEFLSSPCAAVWYVVVAAGWWWQTCADCGQCGEVASAENHGGQPVGAAVPGRPVGFFYSFVKSLLRAREHSRQRNPLPSTCLP